MEDIMSRFIQLHLLTAYPPSNLNRDDLGRPKTAVVGAAQRLRISSQSLKRAWRTSELFRRRVDDQMGVRTRTMGERVYRRLVARGMPEERANMWAQSLSGSLGKLKSKSRISETLVFFGHEEMRAIDSFVEQIDLEQDPPKDTRTLIKDLMKHKHNAVDVAMFGRMLAEHPEFNTEAAVQVAHAFTVNPVAVEDDYFTAVDDLSRDDETGAGHVSQTEFGSGLFYLYVCISRDLLVENLGGNEKLALAALGALCEAAAKVSPGGKQNSFASRAYASYVLAEKGPHQPRTLAVSFFKPISSSNLVADAIAALIAARIKMDKAYGPCSESHYAVDAWSGEGSFEELIQFVQE